MESLADSLFLGNTSVRYGNGRSLERKEFQGTAVDVGGFFYNIIELFI